MIEDEMIGKTVPIKQMNNVIWVKYKWVNIQSHIDPEPIYLCVGMRSIEEAPVAEKEFTAFRNAWGF